MSAKTIKSALGLLQDDPDNAQAWEQLRQEVEGDPGMSADEVAKLLEAAIRAHEGRREHEAVARLLEVEASALRGTAREAEVLAELARVLDEELLDDAGARAAYERLLSVRPDKADAADAIERSNATRANGHEPVQNNAHHPPRPPDPP